MLKFIQALVVVSLVSVSGCASRKPAATFNRETLYSVPPSGLWVDSILFLNGDHWTHTGRMWIPPGTIIASEE